MNSTDINKLIEGTSDFDICDNVFTLFSELNNNIDVYKMGNCEKVITLIWHSRGIIGNGGFMYLIEGNFKGDSSFEITANCYNEIGGSGCYNAFIKIFKLFPHEKICENIKKKINDIKNIDLEKIHELDNEYYLASSKIEKLLCEYIKANRSDIAKELKVLRYRKA